MFRKCEFEFSRGFLILCMSPASQSNVWLIEEKYLPELRLSLFECSKFKDSAIEIADEPIMANIKYARRTDFDRFLHIGLLTLTIG